MIVLTDDEFCAHSSSGTIATNCQLIQGRMNMFFDEALDSFVSQIIIDKLASILKQGMDSGAFVSSNTAISQVNFIGLSQEQEEDESYIAVQDKIVQNPGFDGSRVPVFAWIVVTCIIIVVLITIKRFRERNNYEGMNNEPEILGDHLGSIVNSLENDLPLQMEEETIVTENIRREWDMLPIPSSDTPNEETCSDYSGIFDNCGTSFSISDKNYWL